MSLELVPRPTASAASSSAGPLHTGRRLSWLTVGPAPAGPVRERLDAAAALPVVDSVLALPDLHQKSSMEVPSSIAIATRGAMVPEFTSVAVNDGMGVIATGLREDELDPAVLDAFLARVNGWAAAHPLDANRYSLSAGELEGVLRHGARAVLGRYGLPDDVLDVLDGGGRAGYPGRGPGDPREVVPWPLRRTPIARREMGLNFGGNHFLEVQVVERVADRWLAGRWGLEAGQIVVAYHLGPGPLSGNLLHHYSRRTKLDGERVLPLFLSKLAFHLAVRRADPGRAWAHHFRRNGWTPFHDDTPEGAVLQRAMAMAMNFGHAYRMATVRAVQDGLEETLGRPVPTRLVCDVPHNGVWREDVGGSPAWVARHNACRLDPGRPAIIAGSSDVPTVLAVGLPGSPVHSYDHGAGHLLAHAPDGPPRHDVPPVRRLAMTRGRRGQLVARRDTLVRQPVMVERLVSAFEQIGALRSVLWLRPLANLKN